MIFSISPNQCRHQTDVTHCTSYILLIHLANLAPQSNRSNDTLFRLTIYLSLIILLRVHSVKKIYHATNFVCIRSQRAKGNASIFKRLPHARLIFCILDVNTFFMNAQKSFRYQIFILTPGWCCIGHIYCNK